MSTPADSCPPAGRAREALLVLVDVRGRVQRADRMALIHNQGLVFELLGSLLRGIQAPLALVRQDSGSAILLAFQEGPAWMGGGLGESLLRLGDAFDRKLRDLIRTNSCPCEACQGLARMRLKVLVHLGSVLTTGEGRDRELGGQGMVVIHRLLRNEIQESGYVLFTDPAFQSLGRPGGGRCEAVELSFPELGLIQAHLLTVERTRETGAAGRLPRLWMLLRKASWGFRHRPRLTE
jgi:hypothetical protein